MNHFFHFEGVTAGLAFLAAAGGFLRWLYRTAKNIDDTFTFVGELKTNHLPHIQSCLELIAEKLGIALPKDKP